MCGTIFWRSTVCGHQYSFKAVTADCPNHSPNHDPSVACRYPDGSFTFKSPCRACWDENVWPALEQVNGYISTHRRTVFQQYRRECLQRGEADPFPVPDGEHEEVTYDEWTATSVSACLLIGPIIRSGSAFNAARRRFITHIRYTIAMYPGSGTQLNQPPFRSPSDDNVDPVAVDLTMHRKALRYFRLTPMPGVEEEELS
ncbi:MAG: hypothetical protein M1826_001464 [Phylliscum demangeonii]|nr:MAG: hypothetical protein M1826_001464 [Phylliscum demangeonii]